MKIGNVEATTAMNVEDAGRLDDPQSGEDRSTCCALPSRVVGGTCGDDGCTVLYVHTTQDQLLIRPSSHAWIVLSHCFVSNIIITTQTAHDTTRPNKQICCHIPILLKPKFLISYTQPCICVCVLLLLFLKASLSQYDHLELFSFHGSSNT